MKNRQKNCSPIENKTKENKTKKKNAQFTCFFICGLRIKKLDSRSFGAPYNSVQVCQGKCQKRQQLRETKTVVGCHESSVCCKLFSLPPSNTGNHEWGAKVVLRLSFIEIWVRRSTSSTFHSTRNEAIIGSERRMPNGAPDTADTGPTPLNPIGRE